MEDLTKDLLLEDDDMLMGDTDDEEDGMGVGISETEDEEDEYNEDY